MTFSFEIIHYFYRNKTMQRKPVVILSLIGALVFTLIQVILVVRNYQLQESNFKTKYTNYIKDALYEIQQGQPSYGFDNVWPVVDQLSYQYLQEIVYFEEDRTVSDSLFLIQLTGLLMMNNQLTNYIRDYLVDKNLNSEFNAFFEIEEFYLLDFDNEFKLSRQSTRNVSGNYFIQPYTIRAERDNFKMELSYYIEFKKQQKLIFKEMASVFVLLFISTILVFGIFIYTLNRYIKQKRLSDLKTDFINSISHELKTPLATIGLAASSLQTEPFIHDPKKISEIAEMIKRQNKQLSGLVDNVLEAAISGNKKIAANKSAEPILQLSSEIIRDYFEGHKEECDIETDFPNEEFMLNLDKLAYATILTNLFDNSIKYSESKAQINIRIESKKQIVLICVKDQGIGIPAALKQKVFEEFIRIPTNNSNKKVKGFGLGLFTVKRIVEEHNGSVWIESEENKGTEVFIQLKVE